MVHPEVVHLKFGPHPRSYLHPDSMFLPRSLTILRDDIKRLIGGIVTMGIRGLETLDDDIPLIGDQRRDEYLGFLRKQGRHSVEWGIRNLTRTGGGFWVRVAPFECELSCVHFVFKPERYTGDLGRERSDDSF